MQTASFLMVGCVCALATGCAADKLNRTFDPSVFSSALYCPQNSGVNLTHLRLVGWGTAETAILRPPRSPEAPGRRIHKWTTAVIGGQFDILLVPDADVSEVRVAVRVACGPGQGQTAEIRGESVRILVGRKTLDVSAVSRIPST